MGLWENTAFVASPDYGRVADEIAAICVAEGRLPVTPTPRVREPYDDMQYEDDPARWGFAIFPGAPGWTVVKTASLEILLSGEPPRIATLARALGCPAFQLNAYDGDSTLLYECDPTGRIDVSGFCSVDPQRYHREPPTEETGEARFRNPAVRAAVATACQRDAGSIQGLLVEWLAHAHAHVDEGPLKELHEAMYTGTRRWLEQVGGELSPLGGPNPLPNTRAWRWRAPAAAAVALWLDDRRARLGVDADCAAFRQVFAGENESFAGNEISVSELVEHRPLPVQPSRVLYFDSDRRG